MGGSHLLHVYNSTNAYRMKRLTAYIPMSVKRYSEGNRRTHEDRDEHGQQDQERAPYLAEEFRRVAEEKLSRRGSDSQTSDKPRDGRQEEATAGDSDAKTLNERFKEEPPPSDTISS